LHHQKNDAVDNYEERSERPAMIRLRATMHIVMGIFYLIIGGLIMYMRAFGTIELPQTFAYVLSILMFLYGLFRIWRGFIDFRDLKRVQEAERERKRSQFDTRNRA
jgi:uncharacterized membrane protein